MHIARVKVLVGQGGSTAARYHAAAVSHQQKTSDTDTARGSDTMRSSDTKRAVSVDLEYKSPFPELRKRRLPVKPREEMIYSQILKR